MSNKRNKSPIPKYVVTVVSIILVFSVGFLFLIFRTNYIIDIDSANAYNPEVFDRTNVSTIIEEIDTMGSGTVLSGVSDGASSLEVQLQNAGYMDKAHYLAEVFHYLEAKYNYNVAVAMMLIVNGEGSPGEIEFLPSLDKENNSDYFLHSNCAYTWNRKNTNSYYLKNYMKWFDGDDSRECELHKYFFNGFRGDSTPDDDCRIQTQDDVNLFLSLKDDNNQPGIGLIQWSGNRRRELMNVYKQCGGSHISSDVSLYLELDFMVNELDTKDYYVSNLGDWKSLSIHDCFYKLMQYYIAPSDWEERANERYVHLDVFEQCISNSGYER